MVPAENSACPVCGTGKTLPVVDIPGVPVNCNVLFNTRESALRARKGDITLRFCDSCGHIFNSSFKSGPLDYSEDYENSLYFSPVFQDYVRAQAVSLIEDYGIYEKDVIEIGCGNGDFLYLMSEFGGNRGIGFDTSYSPGACEGRDSERTVFIRDTYSEKYSGYKADLICCRQVLEHIGEPASFLASVRRAIGGRLDTIVFFEVPNALYTVREMSIWDIIYEHRSYFCAGSLKRLFGLSSFAVREIRTAYEGQFLCLHAMPSEHPSGAGENCAAELRELAAGFAGRFRHKLAYWVNELIGMDHDGMKAVVWGGGSKGVSFLNMLRLSGQIRYVVDINPRKHGKFIPVTGQMVVEPEFLREYRPDAIIVMNPIYIEEIWQTVKGLGIGARILTA